MLNVNSQNDNRLASTMLNQSDKAEVGANGSRCGFKTIDTDSGEAPIALTHFPQYIQNNLKKISRNNEKTMNQLLTRIKKKNVNCLNTLYNAESEAEIRTALDGIKKLTTQDGVLNLKYAKIVFLVFAIIRNPESATKEELVEFFSSFMIEKQRFESRIPYTISSIEILKTELYDIFNNIKKNHIPFAINRTFPANRNGVNEKFNNIVNNIQLAYLQIAYLSAADQKSLSESFMDIEIANALLYQSAACNDYTALVYTVLSYLLEKYSYTDDIKIKYISVFRNIESTVTDIRDNIINGRDQHHFCILQIGNDNIYIDIWPEEIICTTDKNSILLFKHLQAEDATNFNPLLMNMHHKYGLQNNSSVEEFIVKLKASVNNEYTEEDNQEIIEEHKDATSIKYLCSYTVNNKRYNISDNSEM